MKRLCLRSVALLALTGAACVGRSAPASAPYYKAPAYLPPVYNWTGFYIGANGGGGFGYSKWDIDQLVQSDRWARRRHARLQLPDRPCRARRRRRHRLGGMKGSTTGGCPAGCTDQRYLAFDRARTARLRGRPLHAVHHRWRRFRQYPSLDARPCRRSTTNAGWTVGAGLEFAVAPHWTLKAEYLYVDLGKFNCGVGCGAPRRQRVVHRPT